VIHKGIGDTVGRILVVDDNEMDLLVVRTILEELGHELHFATDGAEALGVFRDNEFDVVVTDMIMPGLDGLSLIREIRKIAANVQVIAVSGVSADELEMAHSLGAVEGLSKPVDAKVLVQAVDRAMMRSQMGGQP